MHAITPESMPHRETRRERIAREDVAFDRHGREIMRRWLDLGYRRAYSHRLRRVRNLATLLGAYLKRTDVQAWLMKYDIDSRAVLFLSCTTSRKRDGEGVHLSTVVECGRGTIGRGGRFWSVSIDEPFPHMGQVRNIVR